MHAAGLQFAGDDFGAFAGELYVGGGDAGAVGEAEQQQGATGEALVAERGDEAVEVARGFIVDIGAVGTEAEIEAQALGGGDGIMKITSSLLAAFALLASTASPASAQPNPPLSLSFEQILALPKGQAIVYTPTKLTQGQSVGVHAITTKPFALRPNGSARGVQIFYFAVKPNDGSVEAIAYDTIPTSAAGANSGTSAGKVIMHDIHFTQASSQPQFLFADGSVRFIAAVVGYDIARTGLSAKPFPLPKELALTVQLDTGTTGLLLPAIQVVR